MHRTVPCPCKGTSKGKLQMMNKRGRTWEKEAETLEAGWGPSWGAAIEEAGLAACV